MKYILSFLIIFCLAIGGWIYREPLKAEVEKLLAEVAEPPSVEIFVKAAGAGNRAVVEKCIEAKVPVNEANSFGDTALIWAVSNNRPWVTSKLIEQGADVNRQGTYGFGPLHWAARKGFLDHCRKLVKAGVEVDLRDDQKVTPLMQAVANQHAHVVDYLIAQSADPSLVNVHGESALHIAVRIKNSDLVASLIKAGAPLEQADRKGNTPLSLAVSSDKMGLFLSAEVVQRYPKIKEKMMGMVKTEIQNLNEKPVLDVARLEKRIHEYTNQERVQHGFKPLDYDPDLANIARGHSKDMGDKHYFEHINKYDESPSDRARKAGYQMERAVGKHLKIGIAENIWQGYESKGYEGLIEDGKKKIKYHWFSEDDIAKNVVKAWMKSPGHRANILEREHVREGVGVFVTEDGRVYATQNFW